MTLEAVVGQAAQNEADIVDRLRTLRDAPGTPAQKRCYALKHLNQAKSAGIRKSAALALSDLGARDATEAIAEVIERPGIAGSSGTLLYVIEELGGTLPLRVFLHVLSNGSYEARGQALDLLSADQVIEDSSTTWAQGRLALAGLQSCSDHEQSAAATEALAPFDNAARA